jgi:hypothetical protein
MKTKHPTIAELLQMQLAEMPLRLQRSKNDKERSYLRKRIMYMKRQQNFTHNN